MAPCRRGGDFNVCFYSHKAVCSGVQRYNNQLAQSQSYRVEFIDWRCLHVFPPSRLPRRTHRYCSVRLNWAFFAKPARRSQCVCPKKTNGIIKAPREGLEKQPETLKTMATKRGSPGDHLGVLDRVPNNTGTV